jgi:hypothetical protein
VTGLRKNWKGFGRKLPWPNRVIYSGGTEGKKQNAQDNRCVGRDSNPAPPKQELGRALPQSQFGLCHHDPLTISWTWKVVSLVRPVKSHPARTASMLSWQWETLSSSADTLFRSAGFCGLHRRRYTLLKESLTKPWFSLRRLANRLIRFQFTFPRKGW